MSDYEVAHAITQVADAITKLAKAQEKAGTKVIYALVPANMTQEQLHQFVAAFNASMAKV